MTQQNYVVSSVHAKRESQFPGALYKLYNTNLFFFFLKSNKLFDCYISRYFIGTMFFKLRSHPKLTGSEQGCGRWVRTTEMP